MFWRLSSYEVTLVKKCDEPPQQQVKHIFDQKRFMKNFLEVNEQSNSSVFKINQTIFKLLTPSKRV